MPPQLHDQWRIIPLHRARHFVASLCLVTMLMVASNFSQLADEKFPDDNLWVIVASVEGCTLLLVSLAILSLWLVFESAFAWRHPLGDEASAVFDNIYLCLIMHIYMYVCIFIYMYICILFG